jgi:hypothetical protein
VILSFLLFHSTVAPIILLYSKINSPKFFYSSPHGSCHPLFSFLYLFHLPDFLQPACFSACLLSLWPLLSLYAGWVGLTGCCGRSAALLTHGQHHTRTQAIKHVCGGFLPERPVSPGNFLCFSPLTPPLSPWLLLTNPLALSAKSCACVYHTRFSRC